MQCPSAIERAPMTGLMLQAYSFIKNAKSREITAILRACSCAGSAESRLVRGHARLLLSGRQN